MQPGIIHETNKYGKLKVLAYISTKQVYVQFYRTGRVRTTTVGAIRRGSSMDNERYTDNKHNIKAKSITIPNDMKSGSIHNTIFNNKLKIIVYIKSDKVLVEFMDTKHKKYTTSHQIRSKLVVDPSKPKLNRYERDKIRTKAAAEWVRSKQQP